LDEEEDEEEEEFENGTCLKDELTPQKGYLQIVDSRASWRGMGDWGFIL